MVLLLLILTAGVLDAIFIPAEYQRRYESCGWSRLRIIAGTAWWLTLGGTFLQWLCCGLQGSRTGALLFLAGSTLVTAARAVNPCFVPETRQPAVIIRHGIYRCLSHPGYLGFALRAVGLVMLAGQWLLVLPAMIYILALIVAARQENRLLARRSYASV